jgi:hypothetical protein
VSKKPNVIPDAIEKQVKKLLDAQIAANGKDATFAALEKLFGPDTAAAIRAELYGEPAAPAPSPTPDPVPAPAPSQSWRERFARPFLLMDGPAYYWPALAAAQVRSWLTAIAKAGLDGVDLELGGSFAVDEFNGKTSKGLNLDPVYNTNLDRLALWLQEARVLGLLVSVKVINSNQSAANGKSDAWWKQIGQRVGALGADNLLVMPVNEDDSRTRATIRSSILAGLASVNFPKAQTIGWLSKGGFGLVERHPAKTSAVISGDRTLLQISDNGPMIANLYGSSWTKGGTPNKANIAAFVRAIRASGSSGGIYSFRRDPDLDGLAAAGAAWGGAASGGTAPVPGGPALTKFVASSKEHYVDLAFTGLDGWREKPDGKGGSVVGWIVVKGVRCEQFRRSTKTQHLKNAYGPLNDHGVAIKSGETIPVVLESYDGKQTNVVPFVWPWKSTR